MKIGIDLKPFTTGSRFRGIGMYAKALLNNIICNMPDAEFHYLNMYSGYENDLPKNERCTVHSYFTGPQVVDVGERQLFRCTKTEAMLEAEVRHFITHSEIDIMLFTSPHEYGNSFKAHWFEDVATIGIVYDVIPLIFPEQCLWNDTYRDDYYESLEFIKSLDYILTISESSKDDIVRMLAIPDERIYVIYAGIDPAYHKLERVNTREIKKKYNIKDPFLMFAGGIDFKKNIDLIIKAYSTLKPEHRNRYQLIIVGKMDGEQKSRYTSVSEINGVGDRVIITGFIPEEDLVALYNITEMFVFPSLYEGLGLPVLEAMSCGARVVTSNTSSLKEIAGEYATLVNPKSAGSIARGITYTLDHPVQTLEISEKAIIYAQGFTWKKTAEKAIEIISKMPLKIWKKKSYSFSTSSGLLAAIAKEYVNLGIRMEKYVADTIGKQLVILEENLPEYCVSDVPRILFDMTVVREWVKARYSTGIGRVSVELRRSLECLTPLVTVAVDSDKDKDLVLKRINDVTMDVTEERINPNAGDIFLMPELQIKGEHVSRTHPSLRSLREKGIKCIALLYDILPIMLPEFFQKGTSETFEDYVKDMIENYDGIVGISKATIDNLINYFNTVDKFEIPHAVKLGYSHLGMNSFDINSNASLPHEIEEFFSNPNGVFLMVGTLEPRKGHQIVLNAFEEIWGNGEFTSLCIIGHIGWNMDGFITKIKNHPELGKKLLFLEAAPDSYLQYAYNNAAALIQASAGEGFGLPLIEAGQYGLPVICSDIPVFREIMEGHALFFDRNDLNSLKVCIAKITDMRDSDEVPDSSKIPMLTWNQSAENLLGLIMDDRQKWLAEIETTGKVTPL